MGKSINIRTCRYIFTLLVVFSIVFLIVGCTTKITSLEKFENKHVTLEGEVVRYINYGSLKAYEFENNGYKLTVFPDDSTELPKEKSIITLSGIIHKDPIIGYELILDQE